MSEPEDQRRSGARHPSSGGGSGTERSPGEYEAGAVPEPERSRSPDELTRKIPDPLDVPPDEDVTKRAVPAELPRRRRDDEVAEPEAPEGAGEGDFGREGPTAVIPNEEYAKLLGESDLLSSVPAALAGGRDAAPPKESVSPSGDDRAARADIATPAGDEPAELSDAASSGPPPDGAISTEETERPTFSPPPPSPSSRSAEPSAPARDFSPSFTESLLTDPDEVDQPVNTPDLAAMRASRSPTEAAPTEEMERPTFSPPPPSPSSRSAEPSAPARDFSPSFTESLLTDPDEPMASRGDQPEAPNDPSAPARSPSLDHSFTESLLTDPDELTAPHYPPGDLPPPLSPLTSPSLGARPFADSLVVAPERPLAPRDLLAHEGEQAASGLDADKTSKIDGLPPFALLEKVKQLPADPETESRQDRQDTGAVEAPSDREAPGRETSSEELERSRSGRPQGQDRVEPRPRRREGVSWPVFVASNLIMLVLGALLGGIIVFYQLGGRWSYGPGGFVVTYPGGEQPAGASGEAHQGQGTRQDATGGETGGASISGGSGDRAGNASSSQRPTSSVPGSSRPSAGSATPDEGALDTSNGGTNPDTAPSHGGDGAVEEHLLPLVFPFRHGRPLRADEAAIRALGRRLVQDRSLVGEIVPFVHPVENLRPYRVSEIETARAEAALEILRSEGASRRRFVIRPAPAGQSPPAGSLMRDGVRAVLLRLKRH